MPSSTLRVVLADAELEIVRTQTVPDVCSHAGARDQACRQNTTNSTTRAAWMTRVRSSGVIEPLAATSSSK